MFHLFWYYSSWCNIIVYIRYRRLSIKWVLFLHLQRYHPYAHIVLFTESYVSYLSILVLSSLSSFVFSLRSSSLSSFVITLLSSFDLVRPLFVRHLSSSRIRLQTHESLVLQESNICFTVLNIYFKRFVNTYLSIFLKSSDFDYFRPKVVYSTLQLAKFHISVPTETL